MLLHPLEHLELNDVGQDRHDHDAGKVGVEDWVDVADCAALDLVNKHVLVGEAASIEGDASSSHVRADKGSAYHDHLIKCEKANDCEKNGKTNINTPEKGSA